MIEFNKYQSSLESLGFDSLEQEIKDKFMECITCIPFINYMVSPDRKYARDMPRDDEGKIIVDVCHPHILENMDYFRQTAILYEENHVYTKLKPNKNPNSEFGKWVSEEVRRCWEGYIRPEDGEWVTGDMYYFLNYSRMDKTVSRGEHTKSADRIVGFPSTWDGIYLRYHYWNQARYGGLYDWGGGHHALELASRQKGKSYTVASVLAKCFTIGLNSKTKRGVKAIITAYQKEYLTKDNTLNKFETDIDFAAQHTQFPHLRLQSSLDKMTWVMGYYDLNTGTKKGTQNSVYGVTSKDNSEKLRGKRPSVLILEEAGSFPKLRTLYNTMLPAVEDGDLVYGQIIGIGTSGDKNSDFESMSSMMYHPRGYNMYALPNVFDVNSKGEFVFFFGSYLNRAGSYDHDGNSDVTKALVSILKARYLKKYNTTDLEDVTKMTAEEPITPKEAIIRNTFHKFPVQSLTDRLHELDTNPGEYDNVFVGKLVMESSGTITFKPTNDLPIREFPLKDNKAKGAIEIYKKPEIDKRTNRPYANRYIAGIDNYRNDVSETMSLGSIFVMDLWLDKIVCEYTGRPDYADDFNEICRRILLYYNARANYENNIKGTYSYFGKMNCLYLLTETLEFLKDKDMIKGGSIGNTSRGTPALANINAYADDLILNWLISPKIVEKTGEDGKTELVTVNNITTLRNRALIKELIAYNPDINVDRIRALGMCLLLREDRLVTFGGTFNTYSAKNDKTYIGNDSFFTRNYESSMNRKGAVWKKVP